MLEIVQSYMAYLMVKHTHTLHKAFAITRRNSTASEAKHTKSTRHIISNKKLTQGTRNHTVPRIPGIYLKRHLCVLIQQWNVKYQPSE